MWLGPLRRHRADGKKLKNLRIGSVWLDARTTLRDYGLCLIASDLF
jgi:hypothetical protein